MNQIKGASRLELAERLERATGPDREIDAAIATAVFNVSPSLAAGVPAYTASIDAALSLVPEDAWWSVMRAPCAEGYDAEVANDDTRRAATPALALCAAALRARP